MERRHSNRPVVGREHHARVRRAWSVHDFRAFERATRGENLLDLVMREEFEREVARKRLMPGTFVDGSVL